MNNKNIPWFYLICRRRPLGEVQTVVFNMRHILLAVDEVEDERVLRLLPRLPAVAIVIAADTAAAAPVRHVTSDNGLIAAAASTNSSSITVWGVIHATTAGDGGFLNSWRRRRGFNVGVEIFLRQAGGGGRRRRVLETTAVTRRYAGRGSNGLANCRRRRRCRYHRWRRRKAGGDNGFRKARLVDRLSGRGTDIHVLK